MDMSAVCSPVRLSAPRWAAKRLRRPLRVQAFLGEVGAAISERGQPAQGTWPEEVKLTEPPPPSPLSSGRGSLRGSHRWYPPRPDERVGAPKPPAEGPARESVAGRGEQAGLRLSCLVITGIFPGATLWSR